MQIRRRLVDAGIVTETRPGGADAWQPSSPREALGHEPAFQPGWEVERARSSGVAEGGPVIPVQPLTVRTFSVSERHNVQAARGFMDRFHPRLATVARRFTDLTHRPLPGLSPGRLWYAQPTYFMGNPMTYVPSGIDVAFAPFSDVLDYEMQLAFVLGAPLRDATEEQGEAAVAAAVLLCDFSARDVQIREMSTRLGPQKGKHFLSSMAATAVSAEEVLGTWRELTGSVRVNGELVASPTTRGARWTVGRLLAHASRGEQLQAGEVFSTGSLADGSGMEVGRWLSPGDDLHLELPGVGEIRHRVVAAPRA